MRGLGLLLFLAWPATVAAGIYNSAEPPEPLDSDLKRFVELRLAELRALAPPDPQMQMGQTKATARDQYLEKIAALREKEQAGTLTAEDAANLGAYLYRVRRTQPRLPDLQEATQVLEAARRQHPRHFAILANLGTVYQASGALDAAESCLEEALSLASPEDAPFERYQLLLVKRRMRERLSQGSPPLDAIFFRDPRQPVQFVGPSGKYEIGRLAPAEIAKLPGGSLAEATRIVQQLLVWLPEDGRLHWLLAELAAAQGQTHAAAKAMQLCVDNFRLSTPELKLRRLWLMEYVDWEDALARIGPFSRQSAWLARWLLASAGPDVAAGAPSLWPVTVASQAEPIRPRSLAEQMLDSQAGGRPVGPVFHWGMVPLPLAAAGVLVILLLIALQVREWYRKLRRRLSNAE